MAIQNAVSNQFLTTTSTPAFVNVINGFTSTATAAGTTVLTATSTGIQEFTGTTTQTVTLPVVSTLPRTGVQYYIVNNSSGVVTVQSSGANTIQAMDANTSLLLTCILATGTTAASWNATYFADSGLAGAVLLNPTGNQTINGAFNLIMATGSMVAPTVLPGNLSLTGNTIASTDTNGQINIVPNGTGIVMLTGSTPFANSGTGTIQSSKISSTPAIALGSFTNGAGNSGTYNCYKSRSTTIGSHTAVQTNDALLTIGAYADDGTSFLQSAAVIATATGTISTGIVPGQWNWYTANSSGVLTLGLTLSNSQVLTAIGQVIAPSFAPNTTSGIIGTTTNNNAAAGSVGEVISANNPGGGSAINLTTATAAAVTSISLTAGDWDVYGCVVYSNGATTNLVSARGFISTSVSLLSAEFSAVVDYGTAGLVLNGVIGLTCPPIRISISSTTTIYLVAYANFTIGVSTAYGQIYARRRR